MDYILGLDLGIASIGWSVMKTDYHDDPCKIEDLGVRIFNKPENYKNKSLTAIRREYRSIRRQERRKRTRMKSLKGAIQAEGIMTRQEMADLFQDGKIEKDVYFLRMEGLDRKLLPDEWVRVLLHFSKHRGYYQNGADKKEGALKKAIKENTAVMAEAGYRTIAEMLCKDESCFRVDPRGMVNHVVRNKNGDYKYCFTREQVMSEVSMIFAAQRQYGNEHASESFEDRYCSILFSQRNYDEGPGGDSPYRVRDQRGHCPFEPQYRRAYQATYTFEYFKLLQDLNHIKILGDGEPRFLNQAERKKLIDLCFSKEGPYTFSTIRKELNLPDTVRFNMVRYDSMDIKACEAKSKLKELQSYHKLQTALDAYQPEYGKTLTPVQLDQIASILSRYSSESLRLRELKNKGFDEELVHALNELSFSKVGNLSLIAMRKLIPYLEQGMIYTDACMAAYGVYQPVPDIERQQFLNMNFLKEHGFLEGEKNPVVLRAISQCLKVINAIIKKYGQPQRICIEVARDLGRSGKLRNLISAKQKKNEKDNEEAREAIEKIKGSRVTGMDIIKWKLFHEQGGISMYSGKPIELQRIFEQGYVEVDHILPYSRSMDDLITNKVLVLKAENQNKGNRTPLEYLKGEDAEQYKQRVLAIYGKKEYEQKRANLLQMNYTDCYKIGFSNKDLTETADISITMYRILKDVLIYADSKHNKKPVLVVPGRVTAYMRKRYGFRKIRDDGDLHHAMDAILIGIVNEKMIKSITSYSKWCETHQGSYVDPAMGEVFDAESKAPEFPEPWLCFRQEVFARLSSNPAAELIQLNLPTYENPEDIKPIFVSRMTNHKVFGGIHASTIYRDVRPGVKGVKLPLTKLKLVNGELANYDLLEDGSNQLLYDALKARMIAFHGDAEKAFKEPFYLPMKNGGLAQEVKFVHQNQKYNGNLVKDKNGIADHDRMTRVDVYHVKDQGYFFVPVYVRDIFAGEIPNKACVANKPYDQWVEMKKEDFCFSLYQNDLIRIQSKNPITLKAKNDKGSGELQVKVVETYGYFKYFNIGNPTIMFETHNNKYKGQVGKANLLILEKHVINILGDNITLDL